MYVINQRIKCSKRILNVNFYLNRKKKLIKDSFLNNKINIMKNSYINRMILAQ